MFTLATCLLKVLPTKANSIKLLLVAGYFVGSVHFFRMYNAGKTIDVGDVWPETSQDLTAVEWAHALSSEAELKTALWDDSIQMLEADVVFGTVTVSSPAKTVPVMAHPPANTSDLSLERFIVKVAEHVLRHKVKKGVKLDFKESQVLLESFHTVDNLRRRLFNIPLWLNADILPGPGNTSHSSNPKPVDAQMFLKLCVKYFPTKTASVGWTTDPKGGNYSDAHIDAMIEAITASGMADSKTRVTFPVRANLLTNDKEASAVLFRRLLSAAPSNSNQSEGDDQDDLSAYTLTVWSSPTDDVEPADLASFIRLIGKFRVYLDVPAELKNKVRELLKD